MYEPAEMSLLCLMNNIAEPRVVVTILIANTDSATRRHGDLMKLRHHWASDNCCRVYFNDLVIFRLIGNN